MNQPKESWSTPTIESLSVDLIRQQEEEILYHLLNSEEAFRLVTGTTSDYRLKEDKREYDAIALLQNIPTYDFRWKESGHREYGVMAHELQAVLPYLVFGEKNDIDESGQIIPQKVNYSKLVPILISAIQQQQSIIQELSTRVEEIAALQPNESTTC
jgi:hypothetical protein